MNKRQKKILKLFLDEMEPIRVNSLMDTFKVSRRTIYNDLSEINGELTTYSAVIERLGHAGFVFKGDYATRNKLLQSMSENGDADPLSVSMRRLYIYTSLLSTTEPTSLNKLSDQYLVSKSSIVTDLELIEEQAKKYHLKMIRNHEGTYLTGKESDIRHAFSRLIHRFENEGGISDEHGKGATRLSGTVYSLYSVIFNQADMAQIESIITQAEDILGYMMTDLGYQNLVMHLLIMLSRLRNQAFLEKDKYKSQTDEKIVEASVYIARAMQEAFHIEVPNDELPYIERYIAASGTQREFAAAEAGGELSYNKDYERYMDELIQLVSKTVGYPLDQDRELFNSLVAHLGPLLVRLKYAIGVSHAHAQETKKYYPGLFAVVAMALEMSSCLELHHLDDQEIGVFTVHFAAAIERCRGDVRVVLVCLEGVGFSHLIVHRLEHYIPRIKVTEITAMNHLEDLDLEKCDLIISTVPLKNVAQPTVTISPFLTIRDILSIEDYIIASEKEDIRFNVLPAMIKKENILLDINVHSKDELIDMLCRQMIAQGYVTEKFSKSVSRREAEMNSAADSFALLSGSAVEVKQSGMMIARLKKPLKWQDEDISLVLLPVAVKDDTLFLSDLYHLLNSTRLMRIISEAKSTKAIISAIQK